MRSSSSAPGFTMPRPCTPPPSAEIEQHLNEVRAHGPKKAWRKVGNRLAGIFQAQEPDSPRLSPARGALPSSGAVTPMMLDPDSTAQQRRASRGPTLVVASPPAQAIDQLVREACMAVAAQGGPWVVRQAALNNARHAMSHEVRFGVPTLVAKTAALAIPRPYLEDQFISRFATWTPSDVRHVRDSAHALAEQNQLPAPHTRHLDAWLAQYDDEAGAARASWVDNRMQAAETLAAHGKIERLETVLAQARRYAAERGEAPMSQDKVRTLIFACAARVAEKARAAAKFGDDKNMMGYLEKHARCYARLGEPAPDMQPLRTQGKAQAAKRQIDLAFVAAGHLDNTFKKAGNAARRRMVRAAATAGAKLYGVGVGRRALSRLVPSKQFTQMAGGYIDRYKTEDAISMALAHADAAQAEGHARLPDTKALRAWLKRSSALS